MGREGEEDSTEGKERKIKNGEEEGKEKWTVIKLEGRMIVEGRCEEEEEEEKGGQHEEESQQKEREDEGRREGELNPHEIRRKE